MREVLILIWLVVLLVGIGLFMFAPKAFQPLLCRADEIIEHQTHEISTSDGLAMSTDLYCVNENGVSRVVGEKVGIPFVLIMVILPFIILRYKRSPKNDDASQNEIASPKESD